MPRPQVVDRSRTKCDRVLPGDGRGVQGMDPLLLLCLADSYLLGGRGVFEHRVRGCAHVCADCIRPAISLHLVGREYSDCQSRKAIRERLKNLGSSLLAV